MEKKDTNPVEKSFKRLKTLIISGIVILLILYIQYARLMIFGPSERLQDSIPFPAIERGPILDRNGELLAITTQLDSVTLSGPHITNVQETAKYLSEILDMDEVELEEKLSTDAAFSFIKRKISPTQSGQIRKLQEQGFLKGIYLEQEFGRNYPRQSLASHVLGYVGTDNVGLDGIEYTFNDTLSPPVMGGEKDIIHGNQVYLTLDMNIQYETDQAALRLMEDNNADSVMILVMAAKSGEILAYSAVPTFDPNTYGDYPQDNWRNRPLSLTFEPGSVFKAFSMASLLENNSITLEDQFYCAGHYETKNPNGSIEYINCLGVHGWQNVGGILKYSCNAGAALASEHISKEDLYNTLSKFGFGNRTDLPLLGESAGLLRKPDKWSYRSKPTLAMGQEIGVSAMQMITAATALTNDGVLLQPHIVKKIVDPQGNVVKEYNRTPVREVLKPETAHEMVRLLEGGSEAGGTGRRARIDNFEIGIKTGTAQSLDPTTGTYSESNYIASAMSIFPLPDPQLISYIVIQNPKGSSYYGGVLAGPATKSLINYMINYLDLPIEGEQAIAHDGKVSVKANKEIILDGKMPNVQGYSKREILGLFKDPSLKISISGSGWVVKQTPSPGVVLEPDTQITLELK
ncbi:penicillin-binding protein [Spirochaeta cellobiosiphila]|uniref:penicillin-binding protein n=1 Tax=Spirochaeta cellobiosiphila TaxID=504483 RepID=UPI0005648939|nr:penicillin-binding transpeptidase domain-containing protein [Spirochaeta cellobiosiphila]